jgi:hypothetical protein
MLAVHDFEHSFLKLAFRTFGHGHCFLSPRLAKIKAVNRESLFVHCYRSK